jgi:predicted RNA-binding protein with TRAM domain
MRKNMLMGLVCCVVAGLTAARALADNEKGTAVIKGKVVFEGDAPKTKPLPPMTADPVCAKAHSKAVPDQGTIVYTAEGNAVPYAFVYVKSGIKGKYDAPKEPVEIDQKGCIYHPHVFGMVVGQPMKIKNSDPTNHNIHSKPTKNSEFNFAQATAGMERVLQGKETFNRPETMIRIKCDVHAWMSSYCNVVAHPFFSVSKSHEDTPTKEERGTFEIKELPAGDYELEALHPNFGSATVKVSVKDGETKEVEIKLTGKRGEAPAESREVILSSAADAKERD